MKPSEVINMRDTLSDAMYQAFDGVSFRMHGGSQELADWLIEKGWVLEVPVDNAN